MSRKRVVVISEHLKLYGELLLERGQVFEMQDLPNDLKLLGWTYVREVEPKEETYKCKCGREFVGGSTDSAAQAHGRRWQGGCTDPIEVDGVQVKTGRRPQLVTGTDPDRGDKGWDIGAAGKITEPPEDPYAGERIGGKEKPKKLSIG